MIEKDFLSIYTDSIYFDICLSFFNLFTYFITCLFFSYLSVLSIGILNNKIIIANPLLPIKDSIKTFITNNFLSTIFIVSLGVTAFNYFTGIYINLGGWIIWSLFIMFCSFKYFNRVSAQWIFFSTTFFIISLISIYCLFWYIINEQNSHIFTKFHLGLYDIHYKSFWSIYKVGEVHFNYFIFTDKFNHSIDVDNTIPYKRDLIYYYVLYSIALCFWFFVLRKILFYHKLFLGMKV